MIDHRAGDYENKKAVFASLDRANHDGILKAEDDIGNHTPHKQWQHCDENNDRGVAFDEYLKCAPSFSASGWNGAVKRNIVYKTAPGDRRLVLDIYYPPNSNGAKAPVFYFIHGGGWWLSTKEIVGNRKLERLFKKLNAQGIACVSVNYRLVNRNESETDILARDCLIDVKDGLRFLRKHEKELQLDMDKLVVFGNSAGGHLALMAALSSSGDFAGDSNLLEYEAEPLAAVSWFGWTDFRDRKMFENNKGTNVSSGIGFMLTKTLRNDEFYEDATAREKKMMEELSPALYLNDDSVPLLLMHGKQDDLVPISHSYHLKRLAVESGTSVEVVEVNNAGHSWKRKGMARLRPSLDQIIGETVVFAIHSLQSD